MCEFCQLTLVEYIGRWLNPSHTKNTAYMYLFLYLPHNLHTATFQYSLLQGRSTALDEVHQKSLLTCKIIESKIAEYIITSQQTKDELAMRFIKIMSSYENQICSIVKLKLRCHSYNPYRISRSLIQKRKNIVHTNG